MIKQGEILKEKNTVKKRWRGRIPVALVFPNSYSLGMSNLGYLTLYKRLNLFEEIVCERVFWEGTSPRSVESNRQLKDFPVILFSIPFEGDYVNVVKILLAGELGLDPDERKDQVILAGGVAIWANPLPLFPFLDGFLLGEWEALESDFVQALIESQGRREPLLSILTSWDCFINPRERRNSYTIRKARSPEEPPFSDILSSGAQFRESYLLEVSRGCGRGCRFCLAGFIYRPPRRYKRDALQEIVSEIPRGAKVGLIGLEFLETEEMIELGRKLLERDVTLTFSSLRAECLNEDFLTLFLKTRSIALAPETASERLKRVINKPIDNALFVDVLKKVANRGIKRVKFYFMYGLPTETEEDLRENVSFLKSLKPLKLPLALRATFTPFVPKPHTPFQWEKFDPEELEEKRTFLQRELRGVIEVRFESLREALLQAVLARGSEDLGEFLVRLAEGRSLREAVGVLPDLRRYLNPPDDQRERLAWEIISTGVSRTYLLKERERAMQGKLTEPCRPHHCKACGACRDELFKSS